MIPRVLINSSNSGDNKMNKNIEREVKKTKVILKENRIREGRGFFKNTLLKNAALIKEIRLNELKKILSI